MTLFPYKEQEDREAEALHNLCNMVDRAIRLLQPGEVITIERASEPSGGEWTLTVPVKDYSQ